MRGIDLGDVSFGLTADTAGLDRALTKLHAFSLAVNKVSRSSGDDVAATVNALAKQERLIASTFQKIADLNQQIRNAGAPTQQIAGLTTTFKSLVGQLTQGTIDSLEFSRAQSQIAARLAESRRELNAWISDTQKAQAVERAWTQAIAEDQRRTQTLGRAQSQATQIDDSRTQALGRAQARAMEMDDIRTRRLGLLQLKAAEEDALRSSNKWHEHLHNLGRAAVLVNGPLSGFGSRVMVLSQLFDESSMRMALFVTGASALAASVAFLGVTAVKAAIQWEQWKSAMISASGASIFVNEDMKYVTEVSLKYGASLQATIPAWTQFATAARLTGLTLTEQKKVFESFMTASSAMHWNADQLGRAFLALEQILSKGKPQMQEVRLQLGQVLPGAFKLAADGMKMTTAELSKNMEEGLIGAKEFIMGLADQVEKAHKRASEAGRQSTRSEIERFHSLSMLTSKALDEAVHASTAFNSALRGVNSSLKFLSDNMRPVVDGVTLFGVGLAAAFTPTLIAGAWGMAKAIGAAATATTLFGVALSATPVGAFAGVVALIARLALFGGGVALAWDSVVKKQNAAVEGANDYVKALKLQVEELEELKVVDADQKTRLVSQQDKNIKAITDELRALQQITEAWRIYQNVKVTRTATGNISVDDQGRVTHLPKEVSDAEYEQALRDIGALNKKKKAIEELGDRIRALRVTETKVQQEESEKQKTMREHYEQEEARLTMSSYDFQRRELDKWRTEQLRIAGRDARLREFVEKDYQTRLQKIYETGGQAITEATKNSAEDRIKVEKEAADRIVAEQQRIIDAKLKAADAAGNMEAAILKAQTGETKDFFKESDLLRLRNLVGRGYTMQDDELSNAVTAYTTKYNERPPGFARGGSFIVGGQGGSDSTLINMMVTPGEKVTVQTPEQQRAAAQEITINMYGVNDIATFARQLRDYLRLNPNALSSALVRTG